MITVKIKLLFQHKTPKSYETYIRYRISAVFINCIIIILPLLYKTSVFGIAFELISFLLRIFIILSKGI